jgi:hypothetical protein
VTLGLTDSTEDGGGGETIHGLEKVPDKQQKFSSATSPTLFVGGER